MPISPQGGTVLLQMYSFATKESVGVSSGCHINSYLTLVKPIDAHLLSSDLKFIQVSFGHRYVDQLVVYVNFIYVVNWKWFTNVLRIKLLKTVLICRDNPISVLCADFNVFVYTTSPTGFWVWCHILQGTGKTWQASQQCSLLGLIQPMFPPRNPGRLTGNRPNSPKATISQPLPSTPCLPLTQKPLPGPFFMFLSDKLSY